MSDTATTTPGTPPLVTTDEETKKRRASVGIKRAVATELDKSEGIVNLAGQPEYSVALADEGIDTVTLKEMADKISRADDLIAEALGETVEKETDSQEEESKKKALMAAIQTIQKRAKRKYKNQNDPGRQKYFLGMRIDTSRSVLEASTRAILKLLATDTLPGGKPTDIPTLSAALDDYVKVQTAQSQDKVDLRGAHTALDALVKEIGEGRRNIQYAVDTIWPARDKANAGIRVAFKLSATRALK